MARSASRCHRAFLLYANGPYKSQQTYIYLSDAFHQEVLYWRSLIEEMNSRPTYLAEIVHRVATYMGFTDASG